MCGYVRLCAVRVAFRGLWVVSICLGVSTCASDNLRSTHQPDASGLVFKSDDLAKIERILQSSEVQTSPPPPSEHVSLAAKKKTISPNDRDTKRVSQTLEYEFDPPNVITEIDIVMMVDNSGSMKEDIDNIMDNLSKLKQWLVENVEEDKNINAQMYLISCYGESKLSLNPSGSYSSDARYCIDDNNNQIFADGIIKKIPRQWGENDSLYMLDRLSSVITSNQSLVLRAESRKIFVFVSDEAVYDDNDENPAMNRFQQAMDQKYGRANIDFFSFSSPPPDLSQGDKFMDVVGKDEADKIISSEEMETHFKEWLPIANAYLSGRSNTLVPVFYPYKSQQCGGVGGVKMTYSHVYAVLSRYYGGAIYSICEKSWKQHFNRFIRKVNQYIAPKFAMQDLANKRNIIVDNVTIKHNNQQHAVKYKLNVEVNPPLLTITDYSGDYPIEVIVKVSFDAS